MSRCGDAEKQQESQAEWAFLDGIAVVDTCRNVLERAENCVSVCHVAGTVCSIEVLMSAADIPKRKRRPVSPENRRRMAKDRMIGYGLSCRPGERGYKRTLATFKPMANSLGGRLREACQLPLQGPLKTRVYFFRSGDLVKIGCTKEHVHLRARAVSDFGRQEIEVLGSVPGGYPSEAACHQLLAEYRERGEWFRYTPEVADAIATLLETIS